MIVYLTMFAASFSTVFLLGLQSKNVQQSRYLMAIATSIGISVANFAFIKYASSGNLLYLTIMATGGAIGIAASIYVHDTFMKKKV